MLGKLINTVIRVLKYTFQHLVRNSGQSMLMVLILAVTFLFVQLFVVVTIASERILTYFENQPQVTVFFRDEATPEQIVQIKKELEKDSLIELVTYISKEQAVEIYKEWHRDEPELLEFVTPEILPASLEISTTQVSHLYTIASQFQDSQFVERVVFQRDLIEELVSWTNAVRQAGLVLIGILSFISLMIILIVMTQNINSFSREIEIMKLVGAGSGYVRWPFILDGVLFAVLAAVFSSLALYWLLPYVQEFSNNFIVAIELFPPRASLVLELGLLVSGGGALLTAIVSMLATWKHLRK